MDKNPHHFTNIKSWIYFSLWNVKSAISVITWRIGLTSVWSSRMMILAAELSWASKILPSTLGLRPWASGLEAGFYWLSLTLLLGLYQSHLAIFTNGSNIGLKFFKYFCMLPFPTSSLHKSRFFLEMWDIPIEKNTQYLTLNASK